MRKHINYQINYQDRAKNNHSHDLQFKESAILMGKHLSKQDSVKDNPVRIIDITTKKVLKTFMNGVEYHVC